VCFKKRLESAVRVAELVRLRIRLALGVDRDGGDLLLCLRAVAAVGLDRGDLIDHIHALRHLAEGGVLAVEELAVLMHDEELAAGGVGGLRSGHGQNAALVREVVLHAVELEFALDAVAGTAHAGAVGAAALDHEAGDDPVEDEAVVKALVRKGDEVAHALRRLFGIELGDDLAAVFHGERHHGICHNQFLPFIARSICRFASFRAASSRLS